MLHNPDWLRRELPYLERSRPLIQLFLIQHLHPLLHDHLRQKLQNIFGSGFNFQHILLPLLLISVRIVQLDILDLDYLAQD